MHTAEHDARCFRSQSFPRQDLFKREDDSGAHRWRQQRQRAIVCAESEPARYRQVHKSHEKPRGVWTANIRILRCVRLFNLQWGKAKLAGSLAVQAQECG